VAANINDKFKKENEHFKERMRKEADERMQQLKKMDEEEFKRKQKLIEDKKKLRDIQEKDKQVKQEQKQMENKQYKAADFASTNLLSQIYETKNNKAFEYRKKNEHLLHLIENQFGTSHQMKS